MSIHTETINKAFSLFNGTQSEFAEAIGVSQCAISKALNGKIRLDSDRTIPIVKAINGKLTPYQIDKVCYPDPNWLPPDLRRPRKEKARRKAQ